MAIWFRTYTLEEIKQRGLGTLVETLGIEITELDDDSIIGTMPVDHRTKQPAGILHGGASVALAESLASLAANIVVDSSVNICVGLEINANHISSVTGGFVTGVAKPLHLGRSTQVWEIKIHQGDRLVCVSRITLAIIQKRDQK
jgi:1,4-dihydroxy-2-naphthoyl-CoA hydrolase